MVDEARREEARKKQVAEEEEERRRGLEEREREETNVLLCGLNGCCDVRRRRQTCWSVPYEDTSHCRVIRVREQGRDLMIHKQAAAA